MIIRSKTFQHKKIYLSTQKSPNGKIINQIDHAFIQKNFDQGWVQFYGSVLRHKPFSGNSEIQVKVTKLETE